MTINKIEYKQARKYLLLITMGCGIYFFYSIIAIYYEREAIKNGPIRTYKIVSRHNGAINVTSYNIIRYLGKEYTITVSRKEINEGKLQRPIYYNKWNDTLIYDEAGDNYVRLGILSLGLLAILGLRFYIKHYQDERNEHSMNG